MTDLDPRLTPAEVRALQQHVKEYMEIAQNAGHVLAEMSARLTGKRTFPVLRVLAASMVVDLGCYDAMLEACAAIPRHDATPEGVAHRKAIGRARAHLSAALADLRTLQPHE